MGSVVRYFYTDPLDAAFMAKKHGMKFYVHPDCLHLLEPDGGDVIEYASGNVQKIPSREWHIEQQKDRGSDVIVKSCPFTKILVRSGVPFVWPETEE